MLSYKRHLRIGALLALLFIVAGAPSCPGGGKQQPKTVADVLTELGNTKRQLKSSGEISAQTDLDISRKLDAANRAYKKFVDDELARLANGGTVDPSVRTQALNELTSVLSGLKDPAVLGIKSAKGQKLWIASVGSLQTILAGLQALQTGGE